jgi:hypothetical protein
MRNLLIIILVFAGSWTMLQAQEEVAVTRENLLMLYRNAQQADKNGNPDEAMSIYKSILFIDDTQPIPYLKMANLYAANQTNAESVSLAITLYKKYLALEPNNRDATNIHNRIAQLQALMNENGWQEDNYNLAEMIQSNQEETRDIIVSTVHPAMKATTKEEIVKAVDDVNDLWNDAQDAVNRNNDEDAINSLNRLLEQTPLSHPLYTQANMLLAQVYGNRGDVRKMQETLTALEENMEMNKGLVQYYSSILKEATPFEEDICGVWVSDLSYDDNAIPYVALEISKDGRNNYSAKILPYCTLAEENLMYKGKDYNYTPKKIKLENKEQYFPFSYNDKLISSKNQISFDFGNEKFRKGLDEGVANVIGTTVNKFGESIIEGINSSQNISDTDAALFTAGTQLAVALVQGIIVLATISKKTNVIYDVNIQEIIPDYANLELVQVQVKEKSNGYKKVSSDTTQMRIYKLNPDDNIFFTSKNNELLGYKQFDKSEAMQMDEYAEVLALKDKGYFNKKSFKKLSEKIVNYCWVKVKQDPNMKVLAYESENNFKHATQGLCYKKFATEDGEFTGWIDKKGRMNGTGICKLVTGYYYVGEFKNNKYSGLGKLTLPNGTVYSGNFENNKRNGHGIYTFEGNVYEGGFKNDRFDGKGKLTDYDGNMYEGFWEKGTLKEGTISYNDGNRYEGTIKLVKKDDKETFLPNGNGKMVLATGEVLTGKWKNGEFVNPENDKNKTSK